MERPLFFSITFGFLIGVLVWSYTNFGFAFAGLFLFCATACFFLWRRLGHVVFLYAAVFLAAVGMGGVRFDSARLPTVPQEILFHAQTLEGVVIREPDMHETYQRLVLKTTISNKTVVILVTTNLFPEFSYGDRLSVRGMVTVPETGTSSTSGFDWRAYLAKEGISYELFFPHITKVSSGNGSMVLVPLYQFKRALSGVLERALPPGESALATGMLLGGTRSLGAELVSAFKTTGLVHIVVLSGYNISLVVLAIFFIFSRLPKRVAGMLAIIFVALFVLMVGPSPSTVRAGIMAVIALLAQVVGRRYQVTMAVWVALAVMVFSNPSILVFDVGFQLSFLATLALVYVAPVFQPLFLRIPAQFHLRELVTTTVAVYCVVTPWIFYTMHVWSISALPLNLIVLPLVPLAMLFSALVIVFGLLSPILAVPFAAVAYVVLHAIIILVTVAARIPFAAVGTTGVSLWEILLWYAGLVAFMFWLTGGQHPGSNPSIRQFWNIIRSTLRA